MTCVQLFYSEN